ncbi:dihydrofolate reductase [Pararhizobium haloflavum]|uniref:dihydrofolate reductase n=1 Tax=Pararhizobium haloflavum TaxID=2037914 RepID=UPI000C18DEB3|nr:dihydrofolate reductase [Pararhizobium haloflavum]
MIDPAVSIIVAVAANGVIGRKGDMPWKLSTDLKRFKALTMGKPIIMGRKTFEAIGKALPGRSNFVLTRDTSFTATDVTVVSDIREALRRARDQARSDGKDEYFIIGGGEIYQMALPYADRLHVTHVEAMPDGDTHFPSIDPSDWSLMEEVSIPVSAKDSEPTRYAVYRRSGP